MSWFARSIANSLKFDDDDDDVNAAQKPEAKQPENPESEDEDDSSPMSPSRGVKEDLSEISKTLSRQFWGVASFLAPPPQAEQRPEPDMSQSDQDSLLGIRSDFAEIGGKFRSGISRLSNNINVPNINVSEITKLASNFLQLESDDETDETLQREGFDSSVKGAVGVTEEVVSFARDVAMHPETWLDFPLPENVGDDDFDLSDAQQEHALAVEQLAPRLAALRIELCPGYMSESCFWKIYFVLVHPRLDKQAAELLSTPQIVEARSSLAHELKKRNSNELEDSSAEESLNPEEKVAAISRHEEPLAVPSPVLSDNKESDLNIDTSSEIVKHSIEGDEIQIVDKSVIEEVKDSKPGSSNAFSEKDEDDADDWLKEETTEIGGAVGKTIPIENEDDVSFSDLEEEDDGDVPSTYRKSNDSSDKDSRDWVRLGKGSDKENANDGENKETNDWLDIDDDIVVT